MLQHRNMFLFRNISYPVFFRVSHLGTLIAILAFNEQHHPINFRAKASMPRVYQSLESEKYLLESLKQDKRLHRQRVRKSASQAITNMIIIVLASVAAFYAIKTMPAWLPVVETTFHQWTNYKYA